MCNGSCSNCNRCYNNIKGEVSTDLKTIAMVMLDTVFNSECYDEDSFCFFGTASNVSDLLKIIIETNACNKDENKEDLKLYMIDLDILDYGDDSLFYLCVMRNGNVFVQNALTENGDVIMCDDIYAYIPYGSEYNSKIFASMCLGEQVDFYYYNLNEDTSFLDDNCNGVIYANPDSLNAVGFKFTYEPDKIELKFNTGNETSIDEMMEFSSYMFNCYKEWEFKSIV